MPKPPKPLITLFTDAGARWALGHRRITKGAWAFWAKRCGSDVLRGGNLIKTEFQHVHEAELIAFANGMYSLQKAGWFEQPHHVLWQSDSEHALLVWKKFRQIDSRLNEREHLICKTVADILDRTRVTVSGRHVKGHQGTKNPRHAVNTFCDRLCSDLLKHQPRQEKTDVADPLFREQ
jgi:ribonuclease HI